MEAGVRLVVSIIEPFSLGPHFRFAEEVASGLRSSAIPSRNLEMWSILEKVRTHYEQNLIEPEALRAEWPDET